ncbi:hypothetical protein TNCV_3388471 [Trichonephila clavipes]|nr:hypothetical protein TNCV_3388471 [Trichonephila clavipes]
MVLKAMANDRRHLALSHDEFRSLDLAFADQHSHTSAFGAAIAGYSSGTKLLEDPLGDFPLLPEALQLMQNTLPAPQSWRHLSTAKATRPLDINDAIKPSHKAVSPK